jgi:hypothetical protein
LKRGHRRRGIAIATRCRVERAPNGVHVLVLEEAMATSYMERQEHREGAVARAIEKQTAKLPSDVFLWTALGCIAASATLQFMGNRQISLFVGQWVPTFLILGLYNKMVKELGSDRLENAI